VAGLGCALAVVVAGAGCAAPGYDAGRLQSQLRDAGATEGQAVCVTDALTDKYATSQLGSHSEPKAAELAFTRGILKKCGVTLPLQPPR